MTIQAANQTVQGWIDAGDVNATLNLNGLFRKWTKTQEWAHVPLLEVHRNKTKAILKGNPPRIHRSSALKKRSCRICSIITRDQISKRLIAGVIYLVYKIKDKEIDPLYVGIAESVGKNRTKLSTLIKNSGLRFSDHFNCNGHIGNLNDSLAEGESGEAHWIPALFITTSTLTGISPEVRLKEPVYVHFEIWDENAISMGGNARRPKLKEEEALRLKILHGAGYGAQLLNKRGNKAYRAARRLPGKILPILTIKNPTPAPPRSQQLESIDCSKKRQIFLDRAPANFVKIIDDCGARNNALISKPPHPVWLSMKLIDRSPSFLIGEISAAGGNFTAMADYTPSNNECALGGVGGVGFEGGIPFKSVEDAVRYLKQFFVVQACHPDKR